MGKSLTKVLFLIALAVLPSCIFAQKTAVYTKKNKDYNRALDLFEKEKYSAAEDAFDKVFDRINNKEDEIKVNSDYYAALCALKLFNRDAEYRLIHFIEEYPESPKVEPAYFQLGRYYFRTKKWKNVLKWLNKADRYSLDSSEVAEYYFREGYANFMTKRYDSATVDFYNIKNTKNSYQAVAIYYYAYISYIQGNYQTAYDNFQLLKNDPNFGPIVPYYITQILYLQEKYEDLVAYAPHVLDSSTAPKRKIEITRLVGNAYYHLKDYKNAVSYLIKYQKHQPYPKRKDAFQLGFAYLQTKDYKNSEKWFEKITNENDSLNQATYYNLGIAYLQGGQKRFAQGAFRNASEMNFDKKLAEDALFNYAKISYDISYQPYNDAISAFQKYIKKYPKSPKVDQAYAYLVGVFSTTKNYASALNALNKMQHKTLKLKMAEQRLSYFRGVQLYNNKDYKSSIQLFSNAVTNSYDNKIKLNAYYWMGQAHYQLGQYNDAEQAFHNFLFTPNAIDSKWYNLIDYNIGYSYFQQKDWQNSLLWFRKFVASGTKKDIQKADALNRIGDAYYVTRGFKNAVNYYDQAAKMNKIDVDYSLYQSAMANGVAKNYAQKKNLLHKLVSKYKTSPYVANSYYQLGVTDVILGEQDEALSYFKKLITNYPSNQYIAQAMLKSGLVYYNKKSDEDALKTFKAVVAKFPNTASSRAALQHIQRIYIDNGNIADYKNYLATVPNANVSAPALDSVSYQAAMKYYFENNCSEAIKHFGSYLSQYPNGLFALNVHFYRGDCAYRTGDSSLALKDFTKVLQAPTSKFTETALADAAKINFNRGNEKTALEQYATLEKTASQSSNILDAQKALLKLYFDAKNYKNAILYADTLLSAQKLSDFEKENAIMIEAKSDLALNEPDSALANFKKLQKEDDKYAAEAIYNIALIQFNDSDYDASEKGVYHLINDLPSYSYWVAKGFVLLSDNYLAKGDEYRAKQTLKMLIANYKGNDEVLKMAQAKLDAIIKAEQEKASEQKAKEEQQKQNDSLNININQLGKPMPVDSSVNEFKTDSVAK